MKEVRLINKLISIIVPVYKTELYIRQCIESILSQTYKNLEIILVDDGSPDNCGKICDEYASIDTRIKVIHKENGGVSEARNHGLRVATGDYIGFVDSDDYIDKLFYQMLVDAIEREHCDIAECYSVNFEDGDIPQGSYKNGQTRLRPLEWLTESNVGDFFPCVVWNKIYKKTLFDGIEFPVGRYYEDEATTYKVVYKSSKIVRLKSALYFYRQHSDSITHLEPSLREIHEKYIALEERYDFFNMKNEIKIAKFAEAKLAIYMISNFKIRKELTGEYKDWRKKIKRIFNDIYYEPSIPLKYKLYLLTFFLFFPR